MIITFTNRIIDQIEHQSSLPLSSIVLSGLIVLMIIKETSSSLKSPYAQQLARAMNIALIPLLLTIIARFTLRFIQWW